MGIPYDEISISTKREIAVCEKKVRDLKKVIFGMEDKYRMNTVEFIEKPEKGNKVEEDDARRWHECFEGLKNWEQRLRELKEILS